MYIIPNTGRTNCLDKTSSSRKSNYYLVSIFIAFTLVFVTNSTIACVPVCQKYTRLEILALTTPRTTNFAEVVQSQLKIKSFIALFFIYYGEVKTTAKFWAPYSPLWLILFYLFSCLKIPIDSHCCMYRIFICAHHLIITITIENSWLLMSNLLNYMFFINSKFQFSLRLYNTLLLFR